MRISRRAERTEPFYAMQLGRDATLLEAEGHDVVRLNLGEPDFGAPPAVRERMRDAMDGRPLPYTPALGSAALRGAIAQFYRDRHGVDIDPGRIVITSGASAALLLVIAALVDPGNEVILADPSYPCSRELVQTFGGRIVSAHTDATTRFQLTPELVEAAWSEHTSAVMIASPANPTGTSVPADQLERICELARRHGAARIVDEIYLDLADHDASGAPARSVLATDPDAIVISSFSKYFAMTGWRLGWCVVPLELVPVIERLATNYFLCASTPAQEAALACFEPDTLALCEGRRLELIERRRVALDGLARLELPVPVPPDGAFYVYFDVSGSGLSSWEFCERALAEVRVALTPGRDFGRGTADTHVRLSYAAPVQRLTEGLSRLGTFLRDLRSVPQ